jgi:hypothetical protein
MAATISASGTWTGLTFTSTNMGAGDANVPHADHMRLDAIKDDDYPELVQFVTLFATAHNLGWQPAKQLLFHLITAMVNRESPMVATTRTYTP